MTTEFPRISRQRDLSDKSEKVLDYYQLRLGIEQKPATNISKSKNLKEKTKQSRKKTNATKRRRTKKKQHQ